MITIDDLEVREEMSVIISRLTDPTALYRAVGEWQTIEIEKRIAETKRDPDGVAWAAWRPYTAARRMKKGNAHLGLLLDEGMLLESVSFQIGDGVNIGTDVPYAEYLQDGTPNMIARPFVGWSPADIELLAERTVNFIGDGIL